MEEINTVTISTGDNSIQENSITNLNNYGSNPVQDIAGKACRAISTHLDKLEEGHPGAKKKVIGGTIISIGIAAIGTGITYLKA